MKGIWTALITPLNEKNEIDLRAFEKILEGQVAAGVTGVIPCGTTGESCTLSTQEKKTLIQTTLRSLRGTSVKVVAGTGSNNTQETIELSKWAENEGVNGLLLVTPYYNKPSQAGLEAHYLAVADQVQSEIILYNVPGRTGVSLTAETISKLSHHPRINTLKEATGNVSFTSEVLDCLSRHPNGKAGFDIVSGDDAVFLPLLSVGATGVISVASNLIPAEMVAIYQAFVSNRQEEATRLQQKYYPIFRDLFIESNPVPIKFAMAQTGWCHERVRLPLVPLLRSSQEKLITSLKQCQVLKDHHQL